MDFAGVAMRPQFVDVPVGFLDLVDLFAGEVGRQPPLPELVFAFDFAFGLRRGGVAQAAVVELERPAQLGERVRIVGEKEAVTIDVKLQGPPVGQEGRGQEVEVGEQQFALVEFKRRLQSSSMLSLGKAILQCGNQRWGEASSCQSSPMRWRCQRRTAARMRWGGTAWARWFSRAQRRT